MILLTTALAQDIVKRTMKIIPFNVNVMDAKGTILASGNPERIGELHAGALLALAKKVTVEVDAAAAKNLHGAQPGVNLPLMVDGQLCGAVGLSGAPDQVRQFGELVKLTAEMILEQAQLTGELQRDARYREAFLLNLLEFDHAPAADLHAWAGRLGIDVQRMQLVFLLEVDDGAAGTGLAEIQRLQLRLRERQPGAFTAAIGPRELAILLSYDAPGAHVAAEVLPQRHLKALAALLGEEALLPFVLTMGIALPGIDNAAVSYQSARTAARVGRQRAPRQTLLSYYELALPVLLSGLDSGWQAQQLRLPLARLHAQDKASRPLRRTLEAWFAHDSHPAATAQALHIHRNTLDYRLRRIGEITGLDLARSADRFLLYVSLLLTAE